MGWLGRLRLWGSGHRPCWPLSPRFHFLAPSSALYASRLYLSQYQLTHPERLAKHTPGGPRIRGTHPVPIPNPCAPAQPCSLLSCDSWSQIQR